MAFIHLNPLVNSTFTRLKPSESNDKRQRIQHHQQQRRQQQQLPQQQRPRQHLSSRTRVNQTVHCVARARAQANISPTSNEQAERNLVELTHSLLTNFELVRSPKKHGHSQKKIHRPAIKQSLEHTGQWQRPLSLYLRVGTPATRSRTCGTSSE